MATVAATQAILGSNPTDPRIIKQVPDATFNQNYVHGGTRYPGHVRFITTNVADNDATQAAAILAGLA